MVRTILWDIDGTLLNFQAAERAAIRECFRQFGLGNCTDEMLVRYSAVNQRYWRRLESGELTREQVLLGRFEEFFASEGIPRPDIAALNAAYQVLLGETVCFEEDAYELVNRLRGRVRQYAVTNGTKIAQDRKLEKSGLINLLDGVFISEQVGAEKPSKVFFDAVFRQIGPLQRSETVIVGDSLTSDMQGGNNAGILCCWYNPNGKALPENIRIDCQIQKLSEIETFLCQEENRMGLEVLRTGIDRIDRQVVELLLQRMDLCARVAEYKREHDLPVLDAGREQELLHQTEVLAGEELAEYIREIYCAVLASSRSYQNSLLHGGDSDARCKNKERASDGAVR